MIIYFYLQTAFESVRKKKKNQASAIQADGFQHIWTDL